MLKSGMALWLEQRLGNAKPSAATRLEMVMGLLPRRELVEQEDGSRIWVDFSGLITIEEAMKCLEVLND